MHFHLDSSRAKIRTHPGLQMRWAAALLGSLGRWEGGGEHVDSPAEADRESTLPAAFISDIPYPSQPAINFNTGSL